MASANEDLVLLGGSPLRLLRFRPSARRVVEALLGGSTVASAAAATGRSEATVAKLTRQLVDAGILHPTPPARPPRRGELTIVIPAHNRAESVIRLLAALKADPDLDLLDTEVIVVDDGSSDGTAGRVGQAAPWAKVLRFDTPSGPGGARTRGLAAVSTDLVAFVDSDCVPEVGWCSKLCAHMDDLAVAIVAPRIVALPGSQHATLSRPRAIEPAGIRGATATNVGQAAREPGVVVTGRGHIASTLAAYERDRSALDLGGRPGPVRPRGRIPYVPAAALLTRTSVLRDLGGFETSMIVGEDVDLVWRTTAAGHAVRYEPAARVAHDHRTTWNGFLRRRFDYGTSAAPLAQRHREALPAVAVSGWSAAAWALAALGGPVGAAAAVATASVSTALLPKKLRALHSPWEASLKLAGRGHLGAGKFLASAVTRAWLPPALMLSFGNRRARIALGACFVLPALAEWHTRRPTLDPVRWVAVRAVDDAAYCAGVWWGCAVEQTLLPLRPDFTSWPGRARVPDIVAPAADGAS